MTSKRKKRTWKTYRFTNGKRESTEKARGRVLQVARKRGYITNAQARAVGRWEQAWYHLNAMAQAGLLKKKGFNEWRPRK